MQSWPYERSLYNSTHLNLGQFTVTWRVTKPKITEKKGIINVTDLEFLFSILNTKIWLTCPKLITQMAGCTVLQAPNVQSYCACEWHVVNKSPPVICIRWEWFGEEQNDGEVGYKEIGHDFTNHHKKKKKKKFTDFFFFF